MNPATESRTAERVLWGTAVTVLILGAAAPATGTAAVWSGTLVLLACHIPVLFGAWCIVGRLTNRRPDRPTAAHELVLTGQVYFVCLIVLGLLLGSIGLLTRPAAVASAGIVGLGMMWIGRRFAAPPLDRVTPRWIEKAIRALLFVALALTVWLALLDPGYAYDTLTYHLFFPARWIQDGAISVVPTWFGDPAPAYAPSATEVYYTWLMLPMGGDFVARGGQVAFWVLLLCAVYALACELRFRPAARVCLCLMVMLIPATLAQALTAMVDVALAAHLVSLAVFSLRLGRRRAMPDLVGLLLAVCLLLGTKFIGIAYLVGMSPLVVRALWRMFRARRLAAASSGARPIAVALILAAVCVGGFWYARDWAETGNPVYPLETKLADHTLFPGAYGREQMENSPFNVRRRTDPDIFGQTMWEALHWSDAALPEPDKSGRVWEFHHWYLGPTGLVAALFVLSAVWAAWRGRGALPFGSRLNNATAGSLGLRSSAHWPLLLLYISTAATFAIFWFVLPFQQPRFAWGPIVLGLVSGLVIARPLRHAALWLAIAAFLVAVLMLGNDGSPSAGSGGWYWTIIFLLTFLWASAQRSRLLVATMPAWLTALWFVSVITASAIGPDVRAATMARRNWETLGQGWAWVDQNLHGARIAYAGNNVPYFLCGRQLKNRVFYVPARRPADGRYYDFASLPETRALGPPNTPGPACDRYIMDPQEWLQNLRDLHVDYVFVSALFKGLLTDYRHDLEGFPIEREWLDALCQAPSAGKPFAQCHVFAPGSVRLYKLNLAASPPPGLQLRRVVQDETDALARMQRDGTPPGQPIRDYPLAWPVIEEARLRPLP